MALPPIDVEVQNFQPPYLTNFVQRKFFATKKQPVSFYTTVTTATVNASSSGVLIGAFNQTSAYGLAINKYIIIDGYIATASARVILKVETGNNTEFITVGPGQSGDSKFIESRSIFTWDLTLGVGAVPVCQVTVMRVLDDTTTSVIIGFSYSTMLVANDVRDGKLIRWIGDSITFGLVMQYSQQQFQRMFINHLRAAGKYVKSDMQGINGSTTKEHDTLFEQGVYEENFEDIGAFVFQLGVNDSRVNPDGSPAANGVSTAQYKAYFKKWIPWIRNNPRNKNLPVLLLGPTPIGDALQQANSLQKTNALFEVANEDTSGRTFAISLREAYTINSSTSFDGLHPNAPGHILIDQNRMVPWLNGTLSSSLYVGSASNFLNQLPV